MLVKIMSAGRWCHLVLVSSVPEDSTVFDEKQELCQMATWRRCRLTIKKKKDVWILHDGEIK